MTTNTQEQQPLLHDMWYTTPEWLLKEQVWITDDQHATDAWRETQWSDEIPF